ncbi:head GIN domain-containing protein [Mucilaginibacter ginkgonis]|uniref:DUF2807 domain-containing protein n=1 Tax=Mucilaginibacter ginkgonis TaxID=2682091 RepID=A0A6I4I303_9SPHI|nr:head GIN domain-containing protein [Mucilaginibacter ginkgonis]QQL48346.1 DUF2807 domain-containing protein [Mucilaginibacter ginkgonis]
MKNLKMSILAAAAAAFTLVTSSCHVGCIKGSGNANTETRKTGNFTKIDIEGAFKVTLKQDSSASLTVTADDNIQKYIHTTIDGERLRIYSRKNLCSKTPTTLVVGVKNLSSIKGSGAVELYTDSVLNVQDLTLGFAGATKANLNIHAANVKTEGSGSTELTLRGQANSHAIEFTGSGHLSAFDFVTGNYDIHTTGAGDLEINVLHSLKTNTTGAASIKYKGSPSTIENSKTGAADLKHVD